MTMDDGSSLHIVFKWGWNHHIMIFQYFACVWTMFVLLCQNSCIVLVCLHLRTGQVFCRTIHSIEAAKNQPQNYWASRNLFHFRGPQGGCLEESPQDVSKTAACQGATPSWHQCILVSSCWCASKHRMSSKCHCPSWTVPWTAKGPSSSSKGSLIHWSIFWTYLLGQNVRANKKLFISNMNFRKDHLVHAVWMSLNWVIRAPQLNHPGFEKYFLGPRDLACHRAFEQLGCPLVLRNLSRGGQGDGRFRRHVLFFCVT